MKFNLQDLEQILAQKIDALTIVRKTTKYKPMIKEIEDAVVELQLRYYINIGDFYIDVEEDILKKLNYLEGLKNE